MSTAVIRLTSMQFLTQIVARGKGVPKHERSDYPLMRGEGQKAKWWLYGAAALVAGAAIGIGAGKGGTSRSGRGVGVRLLSVKW